MLRQQCHRYAVTTAEQEENYEREGWKLDQTAVDKRFKEVVQFQERFRYERDAKPTPEEKARGRYDALKNLLTAGAIELSEEEKKYVEDYERQHFPPKSSLHLKSPAGTHKKKKVSLDLGGPAAVPVTRRSLSRKSSRGSVRSAR